MATTDLDLLPDPDVSPIAFDIPANIAPYARAYFDELKIGGETIDLFICRLFCERAVRWKSQSIVAAQRKADGDRLTLDQADLNQQGTDLLNP